jgi:hypothetical protein
LLDNLSFESRGFLIAVGFLFMNGFGRGGVFGGRFDSNLSLRF